MFIPVAADVATVAPIIDQVNLVTEQLSSVEGFIVVNDFAQVPAATAVVTLLRAVIVGLMLSVTVTVKEVFAEFPAAS